MNILSVHNISKLGREKPLFTDVSFGLNEGEKAALIGKNGGGKSTLLGIIASKIDATDGNVVIHQNSVSYLAQTPIFNPDDTILDHCFKNSDKTNGSKLATIKEYENLCSEFEKYNTSEIPQALQDEFEKITLEMENRNLWEYENSVKTILTELGITDFNKKMKELSGGMAKKVALAQVLVEDTRLLLLDEPTNHLDIETITYLQDYLKTTERAVLMVTHDRYFLDAVCTNIYELDRCRVKLYQGNYSTYLEKKQTEMEIEANTDRRMGAFLRVEKDWLMRGPCARGTKAKARIQNIEHLTSEHENFKQQKKIDDKTFSFETKNSRLGGKILELENISKSYSENYSSAQSNLSDKENLEKPIIQNFTFTFNKGDKIGIFGKNGSGKTTLLNIITGRLEPTSGTVTIGQNTKIAYYEQNPLFASFSGKPSTLDATTSNDGSTAHDNTSSSDLNKTVLEYLKDEAENITLKNGKTYTAGQLAEQFGFEGRILYSRLGTLSGGERKRLYLIRLLMTNPNFLIMDEPTNDFDIFTMSILETFLQDFTGCLLIVSHDRYFMDKIADTMFIMEDDGSVSGFVGKCSEYIQYLEDRERHEVQKCESIFSESRSKLGFERNINANFASKSEDFKGDSPLGEGVAENGSAADGWSEGETSPAPEKKRKKTFKEQKEFESLEAEIMELEEKKSELEAQMASSDFKVAQKAGEEYKLVEEKLTADYARWEILAELE